MENMVLVIVCGRTAVVRKMEKVTNFDYMKEIADCTVAAAHTLVIKNNEVIFEHIRGQKTFTKERVEIALNNPTTIRVLSEREQMAIKKVKYRAS